MTNFCNSEIPGLGIGKTAWMGLQFLNSKCIVSVIPYCSLKVVTYVMVIAWLSLEERCFFKCVFSDSCHCGMLCHINPLSLGIE